MISLTERIALCALYTVALSWPFYVLQTIPFVFVGFAALSVCALILCMGVDLARRHRFRVPFELIWPVGVLCLAGLLGKFAPSAGWFVWPGYALGFLAIMHWLPGRESVLRGLWASVLSIGVVAVLNLARPWLGIVPTAFLAMSDARFLGPESFAESIGLFILGCLLGLALFQNKGLSTAQRWSSFVAAVLAVAAIVVQSPGLFSNGAPISDFSAGPFGLPAFFVIALLFWLTARIGAKLAVSYFEDEPGAALALLGVLAGGMLAMLVMPSWPNLGHVFLLAAFARYGQPAVKRVEPSIPLRGVAIPILGVVAVNLFVIFPGNPWDPRNYAYDAASMLASGQVDTLAARLEAVDRMQQGEHRTHFLRAQIRLRKGDPEGAADALILSLAPGTPRLLPGPSPKETDRFLAELRDNCSALPEFSRGLAYERALLAAGQRVNALALLRLRAKNTGEAPLESRHPLAKALAAFLGAPSVAEELSQWESGELLRVLETLGSAVDRLPEELQARGVSALVLTAEKGEESLMFRGYTNADSFGGTILRACLESGLPHAESWGALRLTDGGWECRFGEQALARIWPAPEVFFTGKACAGGSMPRYQARIWLP